MSLLPSFVFRHVRCRRRLTRLVERTALSGIDSRLAFAVAGQTAQTHANGWEVRQRP
jgi:hypothetical protein